MNNFFHEIINFTIYGKCKITKTNSINKLLILGRCIFLLIVLVSSLSLISILLEPSVNYKLNSNRVDNSYIIILLLLCTPIIEELTFRLFLTKFKKSYFIVSSSLISSFLTLLVFKDYFIAQINYNHSFIDYILLIPLFGIYYVIIRIILTDKLEAVLMNIWENYFVIILHIVTILFAVMHIHNIEQGTLLSILFVTVMPKYFIGIILGFVRLKIGLLFSIILHLIINLPYTIYTLTSL